MEQSYPITQRLLGQFNRPGTKLTPQGWVIHSTAVYGDTDEGEVNYFNTGDRSASAHFFVDWDSITQDIPDDEEAWHAGPYCNSHFLSVELCQVKNDGSATAKQRFQDSYDRYIWLIASKCLQYGWSPANPDQLMTHGMSSARWHETDHTDPCGGDEKSGYLGEWGITFSKVVSDVESTMAMLKAPRSYVMDELYEVTCPVLNIRSAPDTTSQVVSQVSQGTVIHIRNKQGAWFLTSWGPKGGWVYGQYIAPYQVSKPSGNAESVPPSTPVDKTRVAPTQTPVVTGSIPITPTVPSDPILGKNAVITAEAMTAFARIQNADFPDDVAQDYLDLGEVYGVRGDVAFCQMLKETGFYKFGGDVKIEQNNMAGLGAVGGGATGASFSTKRDGVEAHIQHLYAYASTADLPAGVEKLDPRFDLVTRGSVTTWEGLDGKWAVPGTGYGEQVMALNAKLLGFALGWIPPTPVVTQSAQQLNTIKADLQNVINTAQQTLKDLG